MYHCIIDLNKHPFITKGEIQFCLSANWDAFFFSVWYDAMFWLLEKNDVDNTLIFIVPVKQLYRVNDCVVLSHPQG